MTAYTFFFNPMSRALIAQWAFAEAGVEPAIVTVEWDNKPDALLAANPMGKLPTIIHHAASGDRVVSECPAICHYLAEMEAPELLPLPEEKADYFRMMFFATGPVEMAVTSKSLGWEPKDAREEMTTGFGSFDRTMKTLADFLDGRDFVCGSRFTMADVYVGSQVDWGLRFGSMPATGSLTAYQARIRQRPAYAATMGAIPG